MIKGTPDRSLRISFVTRDEGFFVGNGPAVSVGEIVQAPEPPVSVPSRVDGSVTVSFLQPGAIGAIIARPRAAKLFFKKAFLSIMMNVFACFERYIAKIHYYRPVKKHVSM